MSSGGLSPRRLTGVAEQPSSLWFKLLRKLLGDPRPKRIERHAHAGAELDRRDRSLRNELVDSGTRHAKQLGGFSGSQQQSVHSAVSFRQESQTQCPFYVIQLSYSRHDYR